MQTHSCTLASAFKQISYLVSWKNKKNKIKKYVNIVRKSFAIACSKIIEKVKGNRQSKRGLEREIVSDGIEFFFYWIRF